MEYLKTYIICGLCYSALWTAFLSIFLANNPDYESTHKEIYSGFFWGLIFWPMKILAIMYFIFKLIVMNTVKEDENKNE